MPLKKKRSGFGLEMRTFEGTSGSTYLVLRLASGSFHVFVEAESKAAARDCGASESTTRAMWQQLWK